MKRARKRMARRNEKEREDYKPALENTLVERENTEKHHEERGKVD